MRLVGPPSDQLAEVLATGETPVRYAFISLSARDPGGRDAEYIEWHSLDHRPEQYRLPELRNTLRLVSTPECRQARAASVDQYDSVDHVMTYLFTGETVMGAFSALADALGAAGRMAHRLPSIGYLTANLANKMASASAVAGADVIPWRPALGVYLIVEKGHAPAASLADIPGVAGVWWYHGTRAPQPFGGDANGLQITYCYLDDDPIAVAALLGEEMRRRWTSGEIEGLLAAPFFAIVPFEWARHLPHAI
jgi:hypothetical protein